MGSAILDVARSVIKSGNAAESLGELWQAADHESELFPAIIIITKQAEAVPDSVTALILLSFLTDVGMC